MFAFPKLSAPLVKDIRTGEGIAEWVLGGAVTVLTAVGDVGVVKGATFLTILTVVKGIRRGLLKAVALQKNVGIGVPETPAVLTTVGADVSAAIADIDQAEAQATAAQNAPGAGPESVTAGLSPDEAPA